MSFNNFLETETGADYGPILKGKTLKTLVYDLLLDQILSEKLPADAPLNSSTIAKQLNVSRTPVREAINNLVSVGLATQVNHHEAKVAGFLSEEIFELFSVVASMEGLGCVVCAKSMNAEDKAQLMAMAKESAQVAREGDVNKFLPLDYKFHHLIYSHIKTPYIFNLIEQFYAIIHRYRYLGFTIDGRNLNVANEHLEIAKSICNSDLDAAKKWGEQHHLGTIQIIETNFMGKGKDSDQKTEFPVTSAVQQFYDTE